MWVIQKSQSFCYTISDYNKITENIVQTINLLLKKSTKTFLDSNIHT